MEEEVVDTLQAQDLVELVDQVVEERVVNLPLLLLELLILEVAEVDQVTLVVVQQVELVAQA